jgi:hypothetical protein
MILTESTLSWMTCPSSPIEPHGTAVTLKPLRKPLVLKQMWIQAGPFEFALNALLDRIHILVRFQRTYGKPVAMIVSGIVGVSLV